MEDYMPGFDVSLDLETRLKNVDERLSSMPPVQWTPACRATRKGDSQSRQAWLDYARLTNLRNALARTIADNKYPASDPHLRETSLLHFDHPDFIYQVDVARMQMGISPESEETLKKEIRKSLAHDYRGAEGQAILESLIETYIGLVAL